MSTFVWNLLLAVIWAVVLDDLSPLGLCIGFVVSYLVLAVAWRLGLGDGRAARSTSASRSRRWASSRGSWPS